ncbi:sigma-70 family RNA polymerase sigma factor [Ktedonosporobacter rubrisoli]|uniref:Sigma-70 family RNA polymerase sigma factor n=1 Tax=Ktedonosporobacter rubrisoli TaxID=2509675 RepID=A0A4P6JXX3_KTERU|nr:sigma-70 family RNA polymerase sigma factor [Ktedonosporobacter rubrisoli]QBD79876.1 sigma-70 family RNA polymerase sigma factor [Ktedonosporobacter rubrisoli]
MPSTNPAEEIELIKSVRADPAAFDQLYQCYAPRVYRYLRTRMASDEDASDLTQQVFLKAFEALPRYQARGISFIAWLLRIAHNALTDVYRRQHYAISWDALPILFHPSTEGNPEDVALQAESLGYLRQILDKLDADKRNLLALRFAAGLSSSEIAQVTGRSQAAVKKQLARILAVIKEHYHELSSREN